MDRLTDFAAVSTLSLDVQSLHFLPSCSNGFADVPAELAFEVRRLQ